MAPHPLQRFDLVEETNVGVSQLRGGLEVGVSQETERDESVVHRYDYHLGDLLTTMVEWPLRGIFISVACASVSVKAMGVILSRTYLRRECTPIRALQ